MRRSSNLSLLPYKIHLGLECQKYIPDQEAERNRSCAVSVVLFEMVGTRRTEVIMNIAQGFGLLHRKIESASDLYHLLDPAGPERGFEGNFQREPLGTYGTIVYAIHKGDRDVGVCGVRA